MENGKDREESDFCKWEINKASSSSWHIVLIDYRKCQVENLCILF